MATTTPADIGNSVSRDSEFQDLLPPLNLSHFLLEEEFGRHVALDVDFSEAASEKIYPQIVRIVRKNAAHFWFAEEFITQLVNPQRIQDGFYLQWTGKVFMTEETIQGLVDDCIPQVWRKWTEKRLEDRKQQKVQNQENISKRGKMDIVGREILRLEKAVSSCRKELQRGEMWKDARTTLEDRKRQLESDLTHQRGLRHEAEIATILAPDELRILEADITSCTAALGDWNILEYADLVSALHRELYDQIFQHVAHYFYDVSHIFGEVGKEMGKIQTWQAENQRRTEYNTSILEQRAINNRVKNLLIARTVCESALIGTVLFLVSQKILELLFSQK